MITIVYKKLLGRYFIDSINETCGEGVTIELSEPIDAKLVIENDVHTAKRGTCRIKGDTLKEGEIAPKCYTGTALYDLESFIYKDGHASRTMIRDRLVYDTATGVDSLYERMAAAEERITKLEEQIARKITLF